MPLGNPWEGDADTAESPETHPVSSSVTTASGMANGEHAMHFCVFYPFDPRAGPPVFLVIFPSPPLPLRRTLWCLRGLLVMAMFVGLGLATDAQAQSSDEPAHPARPDELDESEAFELDEDAGYGASATVDAPAVSLNDLDASAAGTRVTPQPHEQLEDTLSRVPGARVARTGAFGAYSALRLRGAELGQTTVFVGDVPIAGPDSGPFDLGALSSSAFGSVEVYRGGAPAWLSSGAIGGVVRLMPLRADGSRYWASLSAGSYGYFRLGAGSMVATRHTRVATDIAIESAENNYPYLDDRGTAFVPEDDVVRERANAHKLRVTGLIHFEQDLPSGMVSALVLGSSRTGGEPGAGTTYAENARRQDARVFGALSYTHRLGPHRLLFAVGGGEERRQFTDRFGEIGLGLEATDDHWDAAFVRASGEFRLVSFLDFTTVFAGRFDGYRPSNALGARQGTVQRWTGNGTAELRLHVRAGNVVFELRPSLRVEQTSLRYDGPSLGFNFPAGDQTQDSTQTTVRVGAVVAPTSWMSIVGSAANGRRLPTLLEIFGDRGGIVPSPSLKAETGRSFDIGVLVQGRLGPLEGALELRAFHLRTFDLIRFIRNSQYTAVAQNVKEARSMGLEAGATATLGDHVFAEFSGTFLDTDDGRGHALNWRPSVSLFSSLGLQSGVLFAPEGRPSEGWIQNLRLAVSVRHRGAYFNDPANYVEIEDATWLDLSLRIQLRYGLAIDAQMQDVFDRRGSDFVGYPLPGRQFLVSLRIQNDL